MEEFRVIIAGTRTFKDYAYLKDKCDKTLKEKTKTHKIIVISGTANGADKLGEKYAKERGYAVERFKPDWRGLGVSAGMKRNAEMAEVADALLAFWDGSSKGTAGMIGIAKRKGIQIRVFETVKVLECSSIGDKRFSALFAKLTLFGMTKTIEEWYQLSKRRHGEDAPEYWKDEKGKDFDYIVVKGIPLHKDYNEAWYHLLWLLYLDKYPKYVVYLGQYDDYSDVFKGGSRVCQADSIRMYMHEGRDKMVEVCKDIANQLGVEI